MPHLDATHDPAATTWVESGQAPGTEFPIQNLPFGVFSLHGHAVADDRIGVAIGNEVLDLYGCLEAQVAGFERPELQAACRAPRLNALLALDRAAWREVRHEVFHLLTTDDAHLRSRVRRHLRAMDDVAMALPIAPGDYTDFYASLHHATNVGQMMRPDNPLLPNYKWVPIGYHGRSSSIVVSGTPVCRPSGQVRADDAAPPSVQPTRRLDYELEVGLVLGRGNAQGTAIALDDAEAHMFGVCLLNDWSARDLQAWEYQPLGPFLAKNFCTSLSPWVVTFEALEPFRCAPAARPDTDPAPLPYLRSRVHDVRGAIDLRLEVLLQTGRMRDEGRDPVGLSQGEFRQLYWTFAQMVAHHTVNGCNLRPGDLFGSGTVSGPSAGSRGSLLELAWRGRQPLQLPNGEQRRFLEDGDEVILRGWCEAPGRARIGLGTCRGRIEAAAGVEPLA